MLLLLNIMVQGVMKSRWKKVLLLMLAIAGLGSATVWEDKVFASHPGPYCASSAFPYGFLCPLNDTDDTANNIKLTPIDGTPGGGSDANPQQVGPGVTFKYETGYDSYSPSGGAYGRNVYNWVNVDIRDALFDYGQGIRLYGTTQGPYNEIQYNDGTPLDSPMSTACGGDPNSAAPGCRPGPASPGDVFNACPLEDYAVGPYSGIYNSPPAPTGWVSCGLQGKSIVWIRNQDGGNNHIRYKFKFSLPGYVSADTAPSAWTSKFCVRNHVSLGADQPASQVSKSEDMRRIARMGDMRCYSLSPTTLSGRVTSDDEEATGRPLPGVQLTFSNCEGGDVKSGAGERTNANGQYDVRAVKGARVCITAPNTYTGPDGTQYVLRNPINQGYTDADGGYYHQVPGMNCRNVGPGNLGDPRFYPACSRGDVQLHDRTADDRYDFVYVPVPVAPVMIKSATPGDGTAVVRGQRIDYTLRIENNRDGNYFNTTIKDNIPLNLKQNINSDIFIDSVQLLNSGSPPPGWSSDTFFYTGPGAEGFCPKDGSSNQLDFFYGYGAFESWVSCNVFAGGPQATTHIDIHFERIPAYTTMIVKWHGFVKDDAGSIGVYPARPFMEGYCFDPSRTDFSNPGWQQNCEAPDRIEGLQGAINYTYASAEDSPTQWSNRVFHPIIGRMAPPVKSVEVEGGLDKDNDGVAEYDPDNPKYDEADYEIKVRPDETAGPIEYYVLDADNNRVDLDAADLNSIISPAESCEPLFLLLQCDTKVRWGAVRWPNDRPGPEADYFMDVRFKNTVPPQRVGEQFSNTAKVCFTKYWEDVFPRPIECMSSNPVAVERVRVINPYFGSKLGGVHAGGNYVNNSGICLTAGSGDVNANGPSYGEYVVSAYGMLDITSAINIQNQNNQQCRPDVLQAIKEYTDDPPRPGNRNSFSGNSINAANSAGINSLGYPATGPSKVIRPTPAFGNVYIDQLDLTRRWTLHVEGDLHIRGNITRNSLAAFISEQPSLGIAVNGNVYIYADVTNIDALIYSTGTINTCAKGPGLTLQYPVNGGYSVAECKKRLDVKGVLLGKSIKLMRTTPPGTTNRGTEAEVIELVGGIYALPPPGFNGIAGPATSAVTRERRPRF